jgi:hypothetical protein
MARFVYMDSAGDSDLGPILVRAAVLVDVDRQWFPINADVTSIIKEHLLADNTSGFEFHAYELFSTKGRQKIRAKEERWEILREFIGLIRKYKLPVVYAAVSKTALASRPIWQDAAATAFVRCVAEAEKWLVAKTPYEGAILVADRTLNETLLRSWIEGGKVDGWLSPLAHDDVNPEEVTLAHIADTIHFADSRTSWGVQLADCVSFFVKRHFMKLDTADFLSVFEDQVVATYERL